MIRTSVGIFSVLGLLACSSDAPPGASTAKDVNLTDSDLTHLSKVSLLRAGDRFTLAGYDVDKGLVRWGRLTVDGVLTEQVAFVLPVTPVGPAPVFAATKRTTPGDQLVAIALTTSTTASAYDLVAVVETVDAAAPAAPVVLATLKAGTDPSTVQIAAGAATSGNMGFVAWGTRAGGADVQYLLLPADAVTSAAPAVFFNVAPAAMPSWDCLQTTNGATGLGFSVVNADPSAPQTSDFQTAEIAESGQPILMTYPLTVAAVTNCRIVASPGPSGSYVMVFDTNHAIDAALYSPPFKSPLDSGGGDGSGSVTPIDPLMANATFGGPLDKPIPAWVSSPGGDISIGLQRNGAPQVVRFTYDGAPHGAALTLRSEHGQTGPLASWVGTDGVYVTYTDEVKGSDAATTTKRYFMRIDSPATLP
jgi:hypothetical protein